MGSPVSRASLFVFEKETIMKKVRGILLTMAVLVALTGCGKNTSDTGAGKDRKVTKDVFAMDTYMTITTYGDNAEKAAEKAVSEITRLDDLLSIGNEESEISIVNENGSEIVSGDTAEILDKAMEIDRQTKGAFDISIYPLMDEWGFTTEKYKVPSEQRIRELLKHVDGSRIQWDSKEKLLTLPEGMQIDVGGIAKGYTSSRLMKIFQKYDVTGGIVSLGGNVQTWGEKPEGGDWRVAIENPDISPLSGQYLGTLSLKNKAVITSGGYERYFEKNKKRYHHILDPKTGKPADSGVVSSSIISEDGTLADGLSTAFFVMGSKKAEKYWKKHSDEFDYILLLEDGTLQVSEGIADSFSSDFKYEVIKK